MDWSEGEENNANDGVNVLFSKPVKVSNDKERYLRADGKGEKDDQVEDQRQVPSGISKQCVVQSNEPKSSFELTQGSHAFGNFAGIISFLLRE